MSQRILKTGNSLAVTIPSKFVKALGIKRGDEVKIERRIDKGSLTLHFRGAQQLPIAEDIFQSHRTR